MHIEKTPYDCSGCSLCESQCPVSALHMKEDKLGFLYPMIDYEKCIDCGLCVKSCSFDKKYISKLNYQSQFYGGRSYCKDVLSKSQSGGIGYEIAREALDNNYIVYGAAYDQDLSVKHIRVNSFSDLDRLQGSKYIQSDLRPIWRLLLDDLKNGKSIVFFGTPCQVSAVRRIKELYRYDKLLLVDLICRGVPSQKLWKDYLDLLEKNNGTTVLKPNLRDKRFGWRSHIESYEFANGKIIEYPNKFYTPLYFRMSCSQCPFCNIHRVGDITIGDLWNVENIESTSRFLDNKGVSSIIINTIKGASFFEQLKPNIEFVKLKQSDINQEQLKCPVKLQPDRIKFESLYDKKGFYAAIRRFGYLSWKYRIKKIARYLLKK
ncbi:MAG: 4Fe-4S dicluster domain-containing protein [Bacteroides sp.]|nr:4Fe-4S dicluster domain-containing protein [Bacteroides sp.]